MKNENSCKLYIWNEILKSMYLWAREKIQLTLRVSDVREITATRQQKDHKTSTFRYQQKDLLHCNSLQFNTEHIFF